MRYSGRDTKGALMEELIDIYDRERNFTGVTVPREGAHLGEGQYMLYVLAIIQDMQGRMLITQRSMDKHWAAGWWEVTGGGVSAGETSEEAIVRELAEEVGLNVAGYPLERVYSYVNDDLEGGDNYIVDIYRFKLDFIVDDVVLQASEAIDCKLVSFDEVEQLADQGVFLHFSRIKQALAAMK